MGACSAVEGRKPGRPARGPGVAGGYPTFVYIYIPGPDCINMHKFRVVFSQFFSGGRGLDFIFTDFSGSRALKFMGWRS